MNMGLWIQYGVVVLIVLACVVHLVRKFRASAKGGDCGAGCSCCSSCGSAPKKHVGTPR